MSHSTCWLNRADGRNVGMVWCVAGRHLRRALQFLIAVGTELRMSCSMLAARSARAVSSLVTCHRGRCSLRSSRMRVSCKSLRSGRKEVVTSKRVQSVGVGLPAAAT
eukprot:8581098-Pyramimonas_sp.AAC.1